MPTVCPVLRKGDVGGALPSPYPARQDSDPKLHFQKAEGIEAGRYSGGEEGPEKDHGPNKWNGRDEFSGRSKEEQAVYERTAGMWSTYTPVMQCL